MRKHHAALTVGDGLDLAQHLDDPLHAARASCACDACDDDRKTRGCNDPHACAANAASRLGQIHPQWVPEHDETEEPEAAPSNQADDSGRFIPPPAITNHSQGLQCTSSVHRHPSVDVITVKLAKRMRLAPKSHFFPRKQNTIQQGVVSPFHLPMLKVSGKRAAAKVREATKKGAINPMDAAALLTDPSYVGNASDADDLSEHFGRLCLSPDQIETQMLLPVAPTAQPLDSEVAPSDQLDSDQLVPPVVSVPTSAPLKGRKKKQKNTRLATTAGRTAAEHTDAVLPAPPVGFTEYRLPSFDTRRIIYPGANHNPWWDMPQLILQVLFLYMVIVF
ncbi:hypothetical protein B0H17DRAFT_1138431 [Mycena rosella]|uniref:Uncharacterized protein n=1 Tax=Mycena rosella TaxID=1033263 RepID=A0AAD7D695_MYCRO|nr:hypothetical protein B0H17DRAFT_1138431 [Mycena rosella]